MLNPGERFESCGRCLDVRLLYHKDRLDAQISDFDSVDLMFDPKRNASHDVTPDGTDDSANSLPCGKSQLTIEAVREQGTNQMVRELLATGETRY